MAAAPSTAPTNTQMNIPEFAVANQSSLFCSVQTFGILMFQIFSLKCRLLFYFSFHCHNKHTCIFEEILPNGTSCIL